MGSVCSRPRAPIPTTFPKPARPAEEVEAEERVERVRQRAIDAAVAAERAATAQARAQRRAENAAKRALLMAAEAERAKRAAARLDDPAYVPASDDEDDDYIAAPEPGATERPVKEHREPLPGDLFPSVRDAAKRFETLATEPAPLKTPPRKAVSPRVRFAPLPGMPGTPPPASPATSQHVPSATPRPREPRRDVVRENGGLPPHSPLTPPAGAVSSRLKAFEQRAAVASAPPLVPVHAPVSRALPAEAVASFTCTAKDPKLPPDPRSAVAVAMRAGVASRMRAFELGGEADKAPPPPRPPVVSTGGGGRLMSMLQAYEAKDASAAEEMRVQSFEHRVVVSRHTRDRLAE